VLKVVAGALAVLAGLAARDIGKAYGAASAAFDARVAEDATDQPPSLRPPETRRDYDGVNLQRQEGMTLPLTSSGYTQ
jgi:hypothetical protein